MLSAQRTDVPLLAPATLGPASSSAATMPSSSARMAMSDAELPPSVAVRTPGRSRILIGGLIAVALVGGGVWWMIKKKGPK